MYGSDWTDKNDDFVQYVVFRISVGLLSTVPVMDGGTL